MSLKLGLGLALAILLDTATQIFLKVAMSQIPSDLSIAMKVNAVVTQPLFLTVAVLSIYQLINWLKVLDRADLSFAQPITSLSYVSVCLLSGYYLDEKIDEQKILGISIVLVGVWCVTRTDRSARAEKVVAK
jgi:drug/metabolite transporter (DMT)-like permease